MEEKKQLFLSPVKDCFTQDLQEVITNHQIENAHIEETTEVPPSSKRGTQKKNTVFVDTEVVTTTAPVGRPKKIGKALELDKIHKDQTIKKQVKRLVNFKPYNFK